MPKETKRGSSCLLTDCKFRCLLTPKGAAVTLRRGLFSAINKANLVACRVATSPPLGYLGFWFKAKQQLCTSYIIPLDRTIHNVILFKKRVQATPCWEERAIDGEARGVKGDGNCQRR